MKNRSMDVRPGPHEADKAIVQLNEALAAGIITLDCYSEMVDRLIGDNDPDLSFLA